MTSSKTETEPVVFRGQHITRQLARMHRNRIENLLATQESVLVELGELELMTPSFADECFGVLAERLGRDEFRRRIRLKGATAEVKHLLTAVIGHRLSGRASKVE